MLEGYISKLNIYKINYSEIEKNLKTTYLYIQIIKLNLIQALKSIMLSFQTVCF